MILSFDRLNGFRLDNLETVVPAVTANAALHRKLLAMLVHYTEDSEHVDALGVREPHPFS